MPETNRLQGTTMAVFDISGLAAGFASLNGLGLPSAIRVVKIYNGSNRDVTVSYNDGVDDQDFFPAGATQILDVQANAQGKQGQDGHWRMGNNQIIQGRGTAGTGNFYIIGYF